MKPKSESKTIEEQYGIKGKSGLPVEITVKGSLGLLAVGYRGLMAWRAKRIEAAEKIDIKNSEDNHE